MGPQPQQRFDGAGMRPRPSAPAVQILCQPRRQHGHAQLLLSQTLQQGVAGVLRPKDHRPLQVALAEGQLFPLLQDLLHLLFSLRTDPELHPLLAGCADKPAQQLPAQAEVQQVAFLHGQQRAPGGLPAGF